MTQYFVIIPLYFTQSVCGFLFLPSVLQTFGATVLLPKGWIMCKPAHAWIKKTLIINDM